MKPLLIALSVPLFFGAIMIGAFYWFRPQLANWDAKDVFQLAFSAFAGFVASCSLSLGILTYAFVNRRDQPNLHLAIMTFATERAGGNVKFMFGVGYNEGIGLRLTNKSNFDFTILQIGTFQRRWLFWKETSADAYMFNAMKGEEFPLRIESKDVATFLTRRVPKNSSGIYALNATGEFVYASYPRFVRHIVARGDELTEGKK